MPPITFGRLAALGCTVALTCVSSCGTTPDTENTAAPPTAAEDLYARAHYTVIWSDAAGISLMSPDATYIRASMESLYVAALNGNADAAAPGFWDTLTGPAEEYARDFFRLGPGNPEYGIHRYEILTATHNDTDNTTTATICVYRNQTGTAAYDPDTKNEIDKKSFSSFYRLSETLTFKKGGETAPPGHQSGPDTFPSTPLFGTWKTIDWKLDFRSDNPCRDRLLPGVPPGEWTTPTIADVPHEPSYPGWSNGL